jgi:hypothetical protein
VVKKVLLKAVRGACEGRDFQENNKLSTDSPNLREIYHRMGVKWADTDRNSLHLSAPSWATWGILHFDMFHSGLNLSASEQARIYDIVANINWTRKNREWADEVKLGAWDGNEVVLGAGRTNAQNMIDFVRRKTGLQAKLDSKKQAVAQEQIAKT